MDVPSKQMTTNQLYTIQPEGLPPDSFQGPEFKMQKKNKYSLAGAPDILCSHTISCTSCLQQINPFLPRSVFEHPILHVILCKSCHEYYHSGEFTKDDDGIDNYCRWCGNGGTVTVCEKCCYVFCRSCIRHHVSRKEFHKIKEESWQCFACDPTPIQEQINQCKNVFQALKSHLKRKRTKPKKPKSQKPECKFEDDSSCSASATSPPIAVTKQDKTKKVVENGVKKSESPLVNSRRKQPTVYFGAPINKEPLDTWKEKYSMKLKDISDTIESAFKEFQKYFVLDSKVHNNNEPVEDSSKLSALQELKVPVVNLYKNAEEFQTVFEETLTKLKEDDDYIADVSTTEKDSDSDDDLLSSPTKKKRLRSRRDLNSSRMSSSNENESPVKLKLETKNFHDLDTVVVEDESSDLSDTGSSKLFRKKNLTGKQEAKACDTAESTSDIFDESNAAKQTKPKRRLSYQSIGNESVNSESLLKNGSVKIIHSDDIIKNEEKIKSGGGATDKELTPDIPGINPDTPDPVESDLASDDQILPSVDATDLNDAQSDSSSSKADGAIAAEKNKIALENLQKLRMFEDEDEVEDEDVEELLEKEQNKTSSKPSKNVNNPEVETVETDGEEEDDFEEEPKQSTYKNSLLKMRLDLSDSSDNDKEKKPSGGKRKGSPLGKNGTAKKAKMSLVCDEAHNNPYLSDEDVKLLSKDGDDLEELERSDVDMLLSDTEPRNATSKKSPEIVDAEPCATSQSSDDVDADVNCEEKDDSSESSEENEKVEVKLESRSSGDEFADFSTKIRRKRRRKVVSDSEEETNRIEVNNSSSENDENSVDVGKKIGRKNIRKILDDTKLSQDTLTAEKVEMERRKRLEEDDDAEVIVIEDESSPMKKVAKLFLSKNPLIEVDPSIVRVLKDHQVDGIKFLWRNVIENVDRAKKDKGNGCILAHCMGLGKTLQVIAFLHTALKSTHIPFLNTALVICPLGTVLNWEQEFRKWTRSCRQDLKISVLDKTSHDGAITLKNWHRRGGVAIMSYARYRNICLGKVQSLSKQYVEMFQSCLQEPGPDIVICDEGHVLKNDKTDLSSVVEKIRTKRRVVLTGTPLQNNLMEYHCMVGFIKPRLLGSKKEFVNRFVNPILNGQHVDSTSRDVYLMKKRSHVLHELIAGCVQRRDVECLREHLTPKFEYVIFVRLSPLQMRLYEGYMKSTGCYDDLKRRKGSLFQDFNNFLMIVCHPRLLLLDKARQEEIQMAKAERSDIRRFVVEDEEDEEEEEDEEDDEEEKKNSEPSNETPPITAESLVNMSVSELKKLIKENDGDFSCCLDKSDLVASAKKALKLTKEKGGEEKTFWFDSILPTQNELIKAHDHSGKMMIFLAILRLATEMNEKVVVFSQSLLTLDLIEIILREITLESKSSSATWRKDWDYFRLDGSTNSKKRNIQISRFNSKNQPRARLFLISTKAGGIGINLVGANRAVLFDASWNPTHDIQSIFRIYRFGQVKPCYIYRLISQGTMEEKIYERQILKQSLAFRVVDEQQIERHFTSHDISDLYTYKPKKLARKSEKDETPALAPPKDDLLAKLLLDIRTRDAVVSYHQHDSLLDHQVAEELTEEDRRLAWDEYDRERHPPVRDNDPLMRLTLMALMKLTEDVNTELKRNDDLLKKCKERPLSDIMLNLKIQNRDLNANQLQELAVTVMINMTQMKKKLENTRRVLIHKLQQIRYCQQRKKATALPAATPQAATAQPGIRNANPGGSSSLPTTSSHPPYPNQGSNRMGFRAGPQRPYSVPRFNRPPPANANQRFRGNSFFRYPFQ